MLTMQTEVKQSVYVAPVETTPDSTTKINASTVADADVSDSVETGDAVPYVAFIIVPVAFAVAMVTYKRKKKTEQD